MTMRDEPAPLEPEQLDILLSADLDGERDAAALDLGMGATEAAERLRVTPGAGARRQALEQARDLLARPPAIDPLVAARLRARALRDGRPADTSPIPNAPRRRRYAAAVALAAALVGALALVATLGSGNGQSKSSDSRTAAAAEAPSVTASHAPTVSNGPALGTFNDVSALAQAALRAAPGGAAFAGLAPERFAASALGAAQSTSAAQNKSAQAPAAASTTQTPVNVPPDRLSSPAYSTGAGGVAVPCPAPSPASAGTTPSFVGSANLNGRAVVIRVYASSTRRIVAIGGADCSIISVEVFG